MKSKRKEIKKYNVGGYLQAAMGTAQSLYGLSQLPKARAEFERAQAAAPSLETPAQYYDNYRNAYDSEIARLENDAIQSNFASSVQALQGAGGRALVGGLGSANQLANRQQQQMLGRERALRMQAGQQLAAAEAAAIGRKETRSRNEISMANKGYQAALGNIGSGIGSIGTGLMYGMKDLDFKSLVNSEAPIDDPMDGMTIIPPPTGGATTETTTGTAADAQIELDSDLATEVTKNSTNEMLEQARAEQRLMQSRTRNATGFNFTEQPFPPPPPQRFVNIEPQGNLETVVGKMFGGDAVNEQFKYFEGEPQIPADQFDESMLGPDQTYLKVGDTVFVRNMSPQQLYERELGRKLGKASQNVLTGYGMQQTVPFMKKQGGMMTNGDFNHSTNPIDIVQNGIKVGEATGQEVILNPKQAASIAKESSYARKLFKRFARNAKKNK